MEETDSCHRHPTCECVCVRMYCDISFLPNSQREVGMTEITDTAGRMTDKNLSGWIYEWLGSEGHVDGCVRSAQTLQTITHPLWRHWCPQTERESGTETGREMIPNAKRIHNHPHCTQLACLYDVDSWRRKHICCIFFPTEVEAFFFLLQTSRTRTQHWVNMALQQNKGVVLQIKDAAY